MELESRPLIDRIFILPLYGSTGKFRDVESAVDYLKKTDLSVSEEGEPFVRLEVQVRYSHGLFVDLEGSKEHVIEYLENIHKVLDS